MKTRKIKIALYKNSKSFFGGLIRLQQYIQEFFCYVGVFGFSETIKKFWNGNISGSYLYSHAEIVFCGLNEEEKEEITKKTPILANIGDIKNIKYQNFPDCSDIFFSSSECDGGVRFKIIHPKKENWDFIEISVTEKEYKNMLDKAISFNGQKYGWAGIFFAQFLAKNFSGKNSYFCSQMVSIVLNSGMGNKFSETFFNKYTHFINPRKLHKRLKKFL